MGLCLFEAGQELVADLQLPVAGSVDDYLRAAGEAEIAAGFQRLAQVPTRRARLTMLIDELWPSNDYMRLTPSAGSPAARDGRRASRAPRMAVQRGPPGVARVAPSGRPRATSGLRRPAVLDGHRTTDLAGGRDPARLRSRAAAHGQRAGCPDAGGAHPPRRARPRGRRAGPCGRRARPTKGPPPSADGPPVPAIDITEGRRLGRAVGRALWMLPAQRGCLARSLVLVDLLQRRGIAARLVIGAQVGAAFHAHAWVELHGEPLLSPGGFQDSRLAEL